MSGVTDEATTAAGPAPARVSRSGAEWALFALSSAVILAVVALLVAQWAASGPPAFRATPGAVRHLQGRYQVPVTVENVGKDPAAAVTVTAELELAGEVTEAEQTLDFLAPDEEATVTFVFDRDPRSGQLSVSVSGFREP